MTVTTATTIAAARDAVAAIRAASPARSIALVPTMGALHDGHLALVSHAAQVADAVAVSIFVNPLQFAPGEDLDRYPRTLEADRALLEGAGAALLFAPTATEMYPHGAASTRVTAGAVGNRFEGRTRAGHFDGVLTVVSKLLHIVAPDVVVFGRKDAQQAFLVRRMVADLDLPVRVDVVDTVRDPDGVALSSRNRYLSAADRVAANALPRALEAAASSADLGVDAAIGAAQSALAGEHALRLEYLAVVDPATFEAVDDGYRGAALVLVAARVGTTRLIDNDVIHLG